MKQLERVIQFCFIFAALVFVAIFCKKKTDRLTILAISSSRPFHAVFETKSLNAKQKEKLHQALNQPYVYFGCGGQAFVFFSADGNYVIKFFKQRLFRPSWLLNHISIPKFLYRYRDKRNWKRLDKFTRDYFSYKVAFEELQEQTAVIYSHLNRTKHLQKKLEIIDRLGIHHWIDLDKFDFIVQKRAEKVYDRIDRLMRENNIAKASETIRQILNLISTRAKKGFGDGDPDIRTNCGMLDKAAIKIDVGRFVYDSYMKTQEGHNKELIEITNPFKEWIAMHHPTLLKVFNAYLEESLIR